MVTQKDFRHDRLHDVLEFRQVNIERPSMSSFNYSPKSNSSSNIASTFETISNFIFPDAYAGETLPPPIRPELHRFDESTFLFNKTFTLQKATSEECADSKAIITVNPEKKSISSIVAQNDTATGSVGVAGNMNLLTNDSYSGSQANPGLVVTSAV